jgi:tryptophan synthase beta subunit
VATGRLAKDLVIMINVSGRGDKDSATAASYFGLLEA